MTAGIGLKPAEVRGPNGDTTQDLYGLMGPVAMLASVRDAAEASACVKAGVDFIDAKEPRAGALGAVATEMLRRIRGVVPGHIPLSATLGDELRSAAEIAEAAQAMTDAGADIIKIGLFPDVDAVALSKTMAHSMPTNAKLVAVLLADRDPDFSVISTLAKAGFYGVMLDTADKVAGGLLGCLTVIRLNEFINVGRREGLKAGLAGGLTIADLPLILRCSPDIVGFRGALTAKHERTARLDIGALQDVRAAVPSYLQVSSAKH